MDAELGSCGTLMDNVNQWINRSMHEQETLSCLSLYLSQKVHFRCLWFEGGLWLGCARLCGTGCSWEVGHVISLSKDIDSTVTNRFKQDPAGGPLQAVERYVPLLCAMEDTEAHLQQANGLSP